MPAQGAEFEIMTEMWPVIEGQRRAEAAYSEALTAKSSPPSVDIVTWWRSIFWLRWGSLSTSHSQSSTVLLMHGVFKHVQTNVRVLT